MKVVRRKLRGQAMVEYSIIAHALMASVVIAGIHPKWGYLIVLFNGLSKYYDSVYYVIASAVP